MFAKVTLAVRFAQVTVTALGSFALVQAFLPTTSIHKKNSICNARKLSKGSNGEKGFILDESVLLWTRGQIE